MSTEERRGEERRGELFSFGYCHTGSLGAATGSTTTTSYFYPAGKLKELERTRMARPGVALRGTFSSPPRLSFPIHIHVILAPLPAHPLANADEPVAFNAHRICRARGTQPLVHPARVRVSVRRILGN